MIAVVPPHRDLDADAVLLSGDEDGLGHDRGLGPVQIFDEFLDAALVEQLGLLDLGVALVLQEDPHTAVQEGQLAQAVLQRLEAVLQVAERALGMGGLGRCQEPHLGPAFAGRVAHDDQRLDRVTAFKADVMFLVIAPDAQLQPIRQRVHDGHAHAVQTARNLIAVLVELSARMQLGHDDLGGADALALMHVDGDAATVVAHADAAVGMDLDLHEVRVTGQNLVNAVIDDLIDHVMQARPVVGIADVHAGTLSHGVQTLENLDGIGVVQSGLGSGVGHASGFLFVLS